MKTLARVLLVSLSVAAFAASRDASGDDAKDAPSAQAKSDEASQRFKSGVAFYKDKDFAAALVDFKRAYELVPNYNVLYNLGQTARELKDYAAALTAFEGYLRDGGAKISAARRKEVTSAVEELHRKVGKIKIVTSVDGAEVVLDDVALGVSPLAAPVVVNVGRRKVAVTLSGYAPVQRVVDVASMEEATVSLDLVKLDAPQPKPEPPPPPPPPPKGPNIGGWVALSMTAACGIGAAVTGGLALSAHSSLKTALGTFPGDPNAISDAQNRTRTFALAADVLGGVTIAGAATTAILFFVVPKLSEKKTETPTVAVSPTGVVIRGAF